MIIMENKRTELARLIQNIRKNEYFFN
jgi:hypothetical protein